MITDEFCSLTHIDILLRVNPQAIEECEQHLRDVIAGSSAASGVNGMVALKQTRRANHFELIGRFSSEQATLDYLVTPSNISFRAEIAFTLGSPYEERLHLAAKGQAWPSMRPDDFAVITELEVRPDMVNSNTSLISDLAETQRLAPGSLGQVTLRRWRRDYRLELVSIWRSAEDYEESRASESIARIRGKLTPSLIAPIDDRAHHVLCGGWT